MEWWEILLIVIAGLALMIIIYNCLIKLRNKNIINKTIEVINTSLENPKIELCSFDNLYQIKFLSKKEYFIKILPMSPKHELIITNSNKVIINDDPKNFKRSAKPDFVPGIKQFSELNLDRENIKIILVYPDCHNITKYINESDVITIDSSNIVDGIYYIKYKELEEFLKNQ
ncbi:hypothetical protein ACAG96_08020 [Candidatus Izemoplasma sp. B36]|uniref:hypothetical protein n=1 Tax=Candidatus Izemoplasma sp. B36 TaxID=3242468 RepID=UPI003557551E